MQWKKSVQSMEIRMQDKQVLFRKKKSWLKMQIFQPYRKDFLYKGDE